jgi:hypothetical protein
MGDISRGLYLENRASGALFVKVQFGQREISMPASCYEQKGYLPPVAALPMETQVFGRTADWAAALDD